MAEPWSAHILGVGGGGVVSEKLELSPSAGGAWDSVGVSL